MDEGFGAQINYRRISYNCLVRKIENHDVVVSTKAKIRIRGSMPEVVETDWVVNARWMTWMCGSGMVWRGTISTAIMADANVG